MREIVTVQIGGAGIRLGSQFWDYIRTEHGIDHLGIYHGNSHLQLQYVDVYFTSQDLRRHVPRTILVDSANVTDSTKYNSGHLPMLISLPHVSGNAGTGNVYSHGLLNRRKVLETLMDKFRQEIENLESLQGVQIIHALGGGTGSGLTNAFLKELRDDHTRQLSTWTVLPSPVVSDKVVEHYNAILSVPGLAEYADVVCAFDNEALARIARSKLRTPQPNYDLLNSIAALAMSGTTAGFRFPGQQNNDWRGTYASLIPFPKMHFLSLSQAPLAQNYAEQMRDMSPESLVKELFNKDNFLTDWEMEGTKARYITCAAMFRGRLSMRQIDSAIAKTNRSMSSSGLVPDVIMRSVCDIPPPGHHQSATMVANHTAIAHAFTRSLVKFRKMHRKKAFMHWYDGFTDADFTEADHRTSDLINEYMKMEKIKPEQVQEEQW